MSTNLKPLAAAIMKSGILGDHELGEFRKWGYLFDEPISEESLAAYSSAEVLLENLEAALESEGLVIERVTDVDIVQQYLSTTKVGSLHVEIEGQSADFQIPYGRAKTGEVIIPWKGDNIFGEMTNGLTYLETADREKIFFGYVRELFFGDNKAFMLCTPSAEA